MAIIATAAAATGARAEEAVARLLEAVGEVTRLEGGAWVPVAPGASLVRGDQVATGPDGWAEIRYASGVRLTLGARTLAEIDPASPAATRDMGGEALGLLGGIVRAVMGDGAGGGFEVRSGLVIAAARSTEWVVVSDPKRDGVFVEEGVVSVVPAGALRGADEAPRMLSRLDGVWADLEGGISPVKPWSGPAVESLRARLARPNGQ